jgi:hypothetical protein
MTRPGDEARRGKLKKCHSMQLCMAPVQIGFPIFVSFAKILTPALFPEGRSPEGNHTDSSSHPAIPPAPAGYCHETPSSH